jgi:phosphoribosyl-ATP pyrophosphohydrolase/phosphoribosyl-AMP cyclohydrolase
MSEEQTLRTIIVQDVATNNVLMVAHANAEAMKLTEETGYLHLWSRSRQELWKKGETSGNFMNVETIQPDCDGDAYLVRVRPEGPACHRDTYSCFQDEVFQTPSVFEELEAVFRERMESGSEDSYTVKLLNDKSEALKKVLEEAGEVILEGAKDAPERSELIYEAADLLYHTLVVLFANGVTMQEIREELASRRK